MRLLAIPALFFVASTSVPSVSLDVEEPLVATVMQAEVNLHCIDRRKRAGESRFTIRVPIEPDEVDASTELAPEATGRDGYWGVQQTVELTCEQAWLRPIDKAAFTVEGEVDAIALDVVREDGSARSYRVPVAKGRSPELPLWKPSLFGRRPLFRSGENRVAWRLYRGGDQVDEGELLVPILLSDEVVQCAPRVINATDCSARLQACEEYFAKKPDCPAP